MHASDRVFRVAFTGDFYKADGAPLYSEFGLDVLDAQPAIHYTAFRENLPEIDPAQIGDAQGVIVLGPRVTARSLSKSETLLAIGRFGVGYDSVDVEACTAADVALVTAVGAVDRSVAEATVTWMLALTHHVRTKDRLVREGNWQARVSYMGRELRDRTLGVVGMGGIGRALVELLRGFGMNEPLAFDPFLDPQIAQRMGVKLVSLEDLMAQADFVSIHCPLNEKTRNLIGARELALMKPGAYLINTARGGIVNEDALYETLRAGRIAGAGLDCFVGEPITKPHRFGQFDEVLLAPHAIAWTDEMFREMGRTSCQSMVDLAAGRAPRGVVNRQVLERPGFQQKWARLRVG
jgi:phosphoglycerate dehydrogenase-like enzyme